MKAMSGLHFICLYNPWLLSHAGSSFQTDVQKGDAVIPSSNLGDQSGRPSFSQKTRSPAHASEGLVGTTGNNDTQEGGDKILRFPNQKPSINEKVAIGIGDKLDMKATETVGMIFFLIIFLRDLNNFLLFHYSFQVKLFCPNYFMSIVQDGIGKKTISV